jgi:hypothetical protein
VGDVTDCGLKGYENRHAAKQAAKHHHDNHVRAFKCKRGGTGCGYWHLGALPVEVVRGEATVEEFYAARENTSLSALKEKNRSPAGQLRRWRLNTAAGLARDARVLADMMADEEVPDRGSREWREVRGEAIEVLTILPRVLRQLAENGPPGQP